VLGFVSRWLELRAQCADQSLEPSTIVHASSSGGTHAGLLAGRAACRDSSVQLPDILAIGVAKRPVDLTTASSALAAAALQSLGLDVEVTPDEVVVDGRWQGGGYALPTAEADAAVLWAASRSALVLDRVYTGKAFAGCSAPPAKGAGAGTTPWFFGTPEVNQPSSGPTVRRPPLDSRPTTRAGARRAGDLMGA